MLKSTILFLTNSELGQASVCLALAHELLIRQNTVHIASFASLSNAISTLNTCVSTLSSNPTRATFHPISGLPMRETVSQKWSLDIFNIHNVGFWGALKAYKNVLGMSVPWNGPQYMEIYHSCVEIIKRTKPEVIMVDPLLGQAKDACRALERRYIILSPNTFKEHVPQPWLANFWKYPQLCSGYPYPLPWWLILLNVYLTIRLAAAYMFAPELRAIKEYRNAHGISGSIPNIISEAHDNVPLLLQTHPASDFPNVVPAHVSQCGPILRPCLPISEEDPELTIWLSQRPTALINMGSLVTFNSTTVHQFAEGLRMILDKRPDIQILWKLQFNYQSDSCTSLKIINKEISDGQVRIEEWLPVDPICILLSGYVCCMVHHGGSNSYHEAIRAGVPQVVLPVWFDTYDFAARVEYLGIGVYGNRTTAPAVNGRELGSALKRVLASGESEVILQKAKMVASKLGGVEGRVVACEKILTYT